MNFSLTRLYLLHVFFNSILVACIYNIIINYKVFRLLFSSHIISRKRKHWALVFNVSFQLICSLTLQFIIFSNRMPNSSMMTVYSMLNLTCRIVNPIWRWLSSYMYNSFYLYSLYFNSEDCHPNYPYQCSNIKTRF
jgi:hypothetical protein